MFFWFAGVSFVLVALIFASPAIDYRLVMLGSVLPVAELIAGGPWVLHTLLAPVVAMTLIMVVFRGRRLAQRRWLGLAIGLFLHLVLDGSWSRTELFWWPAFGFDVGDDVPRWPPLGLAIVMELIGLAALAWAARRFGLDRPDRRELMVREGRLARDAMGAPPGTC